MTLCPECKGDGAVQYDSPGFYQRVLGMGWQGYRPCKTCGGSGKVKDESR